MKCSTSIRIVRKIAATLFAGVVAGGCVAVGPTAAESGPTKPVNDRSAEPSIKRSPGRPQFAQDASNIPVSRLLDFSSSRDLVFVNSERGTSITRQPGEGNARLAAAGPGPLTLRLGALARGRSLPGRWTMLGVTLAVDSPATVRVAMTYNSKVLAKRSVVMPAGRPATVWLSLSQIDQAMVDDPLLVSIESAAQPHHTSGVTDSRIWLESVVLGGARQTLVGQLAGDSWRVWTDQLRWFVESSEPFKVELDTTIANPAGWTLVEANAFRSIFANASGQTVCIDMRGRSYWDGEYRALSAAAKEQLDWMAQHKSPGRLEPLDDSVELLRISQGDKNNDGYDESRGTYRLKAQSPRVKFRLEPSPSSPLLWPVLEVDDLPQGELSISVEGDRVDRIWRLADGRVLVELPMRIARPAVVEIRSRPIGHTSDGHKR